MATLTCEFELVEDGDRVLCIPFGLGAGTEGFNIPDAVDMCVDYVRLYAQDLLMRGDRVPVYPLGNEPCHGGRVLAVSVDTSLADVEAVTAKEAAGMLGLSRQRVTQLCDAGLLDSWHAGRARMVSRASVEARLAGDADMG